MTLRDQAVSDGIVVDAPGRYSNHSISLSDDKTDLKPSTSTTTTTASSIDSDVSAKRLPKFVNVHVFSRF